MFRSVVKSLAITSAVAGLSLAGAGVAHPAGKKPVVQDPRKGFKPVIVANQSYVVAQGLTPRAALLRANRLVKYYHITTPHYVPRGYQLIAVTVYPYIPNNQEPSDTQYFRQVRMLPAHTKGKPAVTATFFEVDHAYGTPYDYQGVYFTHSSARLGKRVVTLSEQKYRDARTRKAVDTLYVYWFDKKTRVATEVTTNLLSSRFNRATMLKIAASVS